MNEISRKLTKLKLSGIATILEQRLKQASEENWPYEVFLETLLTDEIERRQNKKLNVRLAKSMLDLTKTMETFDFKFNVKVPMSQIENCLFADLSKENRTFSSLDQAV